MGGKKDRGVSFPTVSILSHRNCCQVSGEQWKWRDINRLPPYTRTIFQEVGTGEKKDEKSKYFSLVYVPTVKEKDQCTIGYLIFNWNLDKEVEMEEEKNNQ